MIGVLKVFAEGEWREVLRVSSSRRRHEVKYGYGSSKSIHMGDWISTTYYYEGGQYTDETYEPAEK
jgi:hypothetical protein